MKNRWLIKSALAAGLMFGVAGTAQAANKTVCDGSTGPSGTHNGAKNKGFWSWFTINASGNDCLTILDDANRHFEVKWSLSGDGSDAVGGMGWSNGELKTTLNYNAGTWSASGKASLQLYGWSCVSGNPQEYYIVENWGNEKYVPWDPSKNKLASSIGTTNVNGGTYDIFITKQVNAGHGCGTGKKDFYQYWSVRTSRRSGGNQQISFEPHANAWSSGVRGFVKSGVPNGYQIMGAEGLNTSSGTLNMTVWK
jgi:hypothetical protein